MMRRLLRWIVGVAAVPLCALGTLTVWPAPTWTPWQLAVLTGEYGYWLVIVALAVAFGAWASRGPRIAAPAITIGLALVAAALLAKPVWQARTIGSRLPAELAAEFGPTPNQRPFSAAALFFPSAPEPVAVRSLSVPGRNLPIDFYPAVRAGAGAAPCVIVIHGGGWNAGDRKQLPELNHRLARAGYAVAAVSYRLAPQFVWPAQRDDALAAIAFLKGRADELRIDPSRLVLLGRSAGGQIAEVVAYTAHDPAIRGLVALYAPSDLVFGYLHTQENDMIHSPALMRQFLGGTPDSARPNYESASALNFVSRRSPPTLLLHGENDPLVWHRHSVRLAARLAECGVPQVFVSLPWATHGFDYHLNGPGGQLAVFAIEAFLAGVTR